MSDVTREFVAGFPAIILTISALRPGPVVESQNNFLVAQKIVLLEVLEAEFLVAQKIVLLEVLEAEAGSARRVDLDDARFHAYLISTGYRHAVGAAPFGSEITMRASFDAILISSLSC